jgi:hypothetical protein
MYLHDQQDRQLSACQSLSERQPITLRPSRRYVYSDLTDLPWGCTQYDEMSAHKCKPSEGPPASCPDPEGKGIHPLVYKGRTRQRSWNRTTGRAQYLLNRFLQQLKTGEFQCNPGADMAQIQQIRKSLKQDPLDVDCRFGPNTEKATLMFQRCVFPEDPKKWDGKIGPKTWIKLELGPTAR